MPDYYPSMTALYQNEVECVNYTREWKRHEWVYKSCQPNQPGCETFIMSPHGGSIETGTTEIALGIAGYTDDFNGAPDTPEKYDYFIFNGTNPPGENGRLHVTSTNYDDPVALELVGNSIKSLAIHGCTDTRPTGGYSGYKACLIGGLDTVLMEGLRVALVNAGFNAFITTDEDLNGDSPNNIINRNKIGKGVQFEITTSLRNSFFTVNTRVGRRTSTTADFWNFVNAVRQALREGCPPPFYFE